MPVQKRTRKNYKQRARRSKGKAHRSKKYIGGAGQLDGPEGMKRFKSHIKKLSEITIDFENYDSFEQKLYATIDLFKGYYNENASVPFSDSYTHIPALKNTCFSPGKDVYYYEVRNILVHLKNLKEKLLQMSQVASNNLEQKYKEMDDLKHKILIEILLLRWNNDACNSVEPKPSSITFGFSGLDE